ncbi:MAG: NAD(P)H-hydrate dehydratase [Planctomycetota bacterium]
MGADSFGPLPPRPVDANKSTMGTVQVVGGSPGLSGAPLLAAHGALRSGSGRVIVAVPASLATVAEERKPLEAMSWSPQDNGDVWTVAAIEALLETPAPSCWVFGCGLGRDAKSTQAMHYWLQNRGGPAVIDADALWHLASDPRMFSMLGPDVVLTPHRGELDRLAEVLDLEGSRREDLSRGLQRICGAVVVAKGPGTVTVGETGVHRNDTGNRGMATAGSGDVLAGVIGALIARGDEPEIAARRGAWLHGRAGDLAAQRVGVESLIAGDIVESLADAFREQEESS